MSYGNSNNYNYGRDNGQNRGGYRSHWSGNDRNSRQRSQNYNNNHNSSLTDDEIKLVNQGRDELFLKKKEFTRITSPKDRSFLLSKNLFQTGRWDIEELMKLKRRLNETRNQLNEKDIKVWKQHTKVTNMTGRIVWALRDPNSIEMCTNAWIKMAEIFSHYQDLVPANLPEGQPFRSVHVCEAPGAFICATNFYHDQRCEKEGVNRQWIWTGLSLNPYYEGNDQEAMVDDDRFIVETLDKWYFGLDNSGNILEQNNIRGLWERIRADPTSSRVHLVTGDGSVDTSGDPNEQEGIVAELHYTEAICALGVLARGGSLVLKMFSLFECETVCLLYILALHFKHLSIFKPASSRAPNGETYVIARGFDGIAPNILNSLLSFVSPTFPSAKALLPLDIIPQSFLDELVVFADYFATKQAQALERNLQLEKIWNRNIQEAVFQLNQNVVRDFRKLCSIDYRSKQINRISKDAFLDGSAKELGNSAAVVKGGLRQRAGGTLKDREEKKRNHEQFLLDNQRDSIELEEGPPTRRRNLGQGKTVTVGSGTLTTKISDDTYTPMQIDSKKGQEQEVNTASVGMKLMKKSGYKEGQGLGVHGQGRATPIEPVMNNTRLGLGHHNQTLTSSSSDSSQPRVFDEPLFSSYDQTISANSSSLQMTIQMKTLGSNLNSVLSSLFVRFDDLESLYKKREEHIRRTNDYASTQPRIFLSDQLHLLNISGKYYEKHGSYVSYRTAFQLASLDQIFQLTSLNLDSATPLSFIIDNESLSGFAEYLIWQQQGYVKGVIISELCNTFPTSSNVVFKPQLGPDQPKVHFLFSDLSSLPKDMKINQRYLEKYNKRQSIISVRRALARVNEGGSFVCKLSDTFTRFTAGLIYLLYRSFTSITILRPFTLDPGSSERFLVCQQLKFPMNESFIKHLDTLVSIDKIENVLEVVPLKCLLETQFQQYMADTVQRLLKREVEALDKRLWCLYQNNDQQVHSTIEQDDWDQAHDSVTVPRRSKLAPVEPDSGITLPIGWTKEWSTKEEQFYYFNKNTGKSEWIPPNPNYTP